MIIDLLKNGNITLKKTVKTWQEAGRMAGGLLVQSGSVEASYVDAMIESIEKYGPYIVLVKGVALFHARPEDGVKEISMSLVTLSEPIEFGAGDKDPVKLVFAFGAVDHSSHIKALSELMKIMGNQAIIDELSELDSVEEVLTLLNKLLKE